MDGWMNGWMNSWMNEWTNPLPPIFYSQCFPFTLASRVTANIVFLVSKLIDFVMFRAGFDLMWGNTITSSWLIILTVWNHLSFPTRSKPNCLTYMTRLCLCDDLDGFTPFTTLMERKWFWTIVGRTGPSSSSIFRNRKKIVKQNIT